MDNADVENIDKWLNIIHPIKGKSLFCLSDVFAESLGEIEFNKHRRGNQWLGEPENIYKQLNKHGILDRKELINEFITDLGIKVMECGGWTKYQESEK